MFVLPYIISLNICLRRSDSIELPGDSNLFNLLLLHLTART